MCAKLVLKFLIADTNTLDTSFLNGGFPKDHSTLLSLAKKGIQFTMTHLIPRSKGNIKSTMNKDKILQMLGIKIK